MRYFSAVVSILCGSVGATVGIYGAFTELFSPMFIGLLLMSTSLIIEFLREIV